MTRLAGDMAPRVRKKTAPAHFAYANYAAG